MKIRLLMTGAVLLALCAPAPGQVPGMFNWWDGPIARDLNLTDEQHKQIRETVREFRDRLIQSRGAVEAAEGDLKDEMDSEPVDTRKAEAAIEKVIRTRGELTRIVSQMSLKLRQVLTSEQWQELQKRDNRPPGRPPDGNRGGRGPGMGGRGPRPPAGRLDDESEDMTFLPHLPAPQPTG